MSMLLLTVFAIIYYLSIQIEIDVHPSNSNIFRFEIKSNIFQKVKLHIDINNLQLESIKCNNQIIFLRVEHHIKWFENQVQEINIILHKGKNICEVESYSFNNGNIPTVKRKITFYNYVILYILLGIPIFDAIFTLFIWVLNKIKRIPFEE